MSDKPSRTTMVFRIAELGRRYSPVKVGEEWRLRNLESGELVEPVYTEESLAHAGARLVAAFDILDYIEAST